MSGLCGHGLSAIHNPTDALTPLASSPACKCLEPWKQTAGSVPVAQKVQYTMGSDLPCPSKEEHFSLLSYLTSRWQRRRNWAHNTNL